MLFCSIMYTKCVKWRHYVSGWRKLFIATVLPSTAVFFHGTYRGAKSVVPRSTSLKLSIFKFYLHYVQMQLANNCWFLNWGQYLNLIKPDFLIFAVHALLWNQYGGVDHKNLAHIVVPYGMNFLLYLFFNLFYTKNSTRNSTAGFHVCNIGFLYTAAMSLTLA